MSENKMSVFFRCPHCGHITSSFDFHENTSSERCEYFVVLNARDLSSRQCHCLKCGIEMNLDELFSKGNAWVEDTEAYKRILNWGLLHRWSYSDWEPDMKIQIALERLCKMYPNDIEFRQFREIYSKIYSFGWDILRQYSKVEIYSGSVEQWQIKYPQLLQKVYLHDGISGIGNKAFQNCSILKDIFLPKSISYIGEEAFSGCSELRTIHTSDEIKELGVKAFAGCKSLERFFVPQKLESIGAECFSDCKNLRHIWLPWDIKIGNNAFSGCSNLQTIEIPSTIAPHQLKRYAIPSQTQIITYQAQDNGPIAWPY